MYVGKGNNAMLIRTLFKSRYWWLLHNEAETQVNFIWTQCRKAEIMKTFRCKLKDAKDHSAIERSPPVKKGKRNPSSTNPESGVHKQSTQDGQQT